MKNIELSNLLFLLLFFFRLKERKEENARAVDQYDCHERIYRRVRLSVKLSFHLTNWHTHAHTRKENIHKKKKRKKERKNMYIETSNRIIKGEV